MVEFKILKNLLIGIILSLVFCFPLISEAKNINIGQAGDSVNVLGSFCLESSCVTSWQEVSGAWEMNGTKVYYNSGNVGVGNSNPMTNLDVTGSLRSSGQVLFDSPLYSGSGTRLLTVDNSGNLLATSTANFLMPTPTVIGQTMRANSLLPSGWEATSNLFVNANGNVGIGTTNPNAKLDINGITSFRGANNSTDNIRLYNTDGNYSYLRTTSASNTNNLWLDATLGANQWYAWDNPGSVRTAGSYTQHYFGTGRGTMNESIKILRGDMQSADSSGSVTWRLANGTGALGANSYFNSGNVGIGTTIPSEKLEVNGNIEIQADNYIQSNNSAGNRIELYDGSDAAMTFSMRHSTVGYFSFRNDTSELMRLTRTGNLGIATTAPTKKLHVAGKGQFDDLVYGVSPGTSESLALTTVEYVNSVLAGTTTVPTVGYWTKTGANISNVNSTNVGIGTTNPDSSRLIIEGSATGDYNNLMLVNTHNAANDAAVINFATYGANPHAATAQIKAINRNDLSNAKTDLAFYTHTGGSLPEVMRLTTGGNIGIGITNPTQKLTVEGGAISVNSSGNGLVYLGSGGSYIGRNNSLFNLRNEGVPFVFINGSTEQMRITNAGNVGIGTTNPTSKLHLFLPGQITTNTDALTIDAGSAQPAKETRIAFNIQGGSYPLSYIGSGFETDATNSFVTFGSRLSNIVAEKMRITSSGNVGISTTNPTQKLHVAGSAQLDAVSFGVTPGSSQDLALATVGYVNAAFLPGGSSALWNGTKNGNIWNGDTGAGNVGIGTTAPGAKLEITQQGIFNAVAPGLTKYGLHFGGQTTDDQATGITWNGGAGTNNAEAGIYVQGSGAYGSKMYFATTDSHAAGAKTRMMINHLGNVGIGTTNPTQKVSIVGTSISNTNSQTNISAFAGNGLRINGSVGASSQDAITYQSGGSGAGAAIAFGRGGNYDTFISLYTNPFSIGSAGSIIERVRVNSEGNVGISTATPTQKLHVAGAAQLDAVSFGVTPGSAQTLALSTVEYVNSKVGGSGGVGTGTTGQTLRHNGTGWVGDSTLFNSGANVGVGTTNPIYGKLQITDSGTYTDGLTLYAGSGNLAASYLKSDGASDFNWHLTRGGSDTTGIIIKANGNIGIGVTNPSYLLHAQTSNMDDSIMYFDAAGGGNARIISAADTSGKLPMLSLFDRTVGAYSVNSSYYIALDRASAVYASRNDAIYVNNYLNKGHYFLTNNAGTTAIRMTLLGAGNLGINTTNPTQKLHVAGAAQLDSVSFGVTPGSGQTLGLTTVEYVNSLISGVSTSTVGYWSANGSNIYNANAGNIGIGTTNPLAKLSVPSGQVLIGTSTKFGSGQNSAASLQVNNIIDVGDSTTIGGAGSINFWTYPTLSATADAYLKIQNYLLSFGNTITLGDSYSAKIRMASGAFQKTSTTGTFFDVTGQVINSGTAGYTGMKVDITETSLGSGINNLLDLRTNNISKFIVTNAGGGYFSGNVGIGTTAPLANLDVRGSYLSFNGSGTYHYRNVASINNSSPSVTGTLKVTMPKTWSNTMMVVTIKGYNYSANGAWEVVVSGYNYSGTPAWVNSSVQINGKAPFSNVRLAHDGTSNVILLGATNTVWTYPKADVTDFIAGHSNMDGWGSGWSMSFITDETSISYVSAPTSPMFVSTSGNVGIATTNPTQKLHVAGAAQLDAVSFGVTPGSTQTLALSTVEYVNSKVGGSSGVGTGTTGQTLRHNGTGWVGDSTLYNTGANVGVGTSNPDHLLHVQGTSDPVMAVGTDTNNKAWMRWNTTNKYLDFTTRESSTYYGNTLVLKAGNVGIGTTAPGAPLHVAGNAWVTGTLYPETLQTYSGDLPIIIGAAGNVPFRTTVGTDLMIIKGDGNVGIATTNPTQKLHVSGAAQLDSVSFGITPGSAQTLALSTVEYVNSKVGGSGGVGTGTTGQTLRHNGTGWVGDSTLYNTGANVGIGTTAPTNKLMVSGSTNQYNFTVTDGGYRTFGVLNSGGTVNGVGIGSMTGYPLFVFTNNQTTTPAILITTGNNVGIGITNPNNLLQVSDLIEFNNTDLKTKIGYQAGKYDLGQQNTWIGYQAGSADNATGKTNAADANIAIGYRSLYANTIGSGNSAAGAFALSTNTSGVSNSAFGYASLAQNSTGHSNTAVGNSALYTQSGGDMNVAVGASSMYYNATGASNSAFGVNTLQTNTTGTGNAAFGISAGHYLANGSTGRTTGNYGLYLGASTKASADGTTNEIVVGYNAIGAGSNSVVLGSDSILKTLLKGNVGIATTNPTQKLHVAGGVQLDSVSFGVTPGEAQTLALATVAYVNAKAASGGVGTGTTGQTLRHNGTGWVGDSTLYNNGTNVGIGTTNPANMLTIRSAAPTLNTEVTGFSHGFADTVYSRPNSNAAWSFFSSVSGGGLFAGISSSATVPGLSYFGANSTAVGTPLSVAPVRFVSLKRSGTDTVALESTDPAFDFYNGAASWGSGTNLMRIMASGKVGIGTTNPGATLTVAGGHAQFTGNSAPTNGAGVEISYSGTSGNIIVYDRNVSSYKPLNFQGGALYIDAWGNTGFGTTAPAQKLHVAGYVRADTGFCVGATCVTSFGTSQWTTTGSNIYYNTGNVAIGTTAPTAKFEIKDATTVATNGYLLSVHADDANPYLGGFFNDTYSTTVPALAFYANNTGNANLGTNGATNLNFYTNGYANTRMTLTSAGNVGIGTTAPGYKLDVSGDMRVTSSAFFDAGTFIKDQNSTVDSWWGWYAWDKEFQFNKRTSANVFVQNIFTADWDTGNFIIVPSGGNVGIGTSTPAAKIDIQSTGVSTYLHLAHLFAPSNTTAGNASLVAIGVNGVANNAAEWRYVHQSSGSTANRFDFGILGVAAPVITYNFAGNVGIGTTAPAEKLDVTGNVEADAYYYSSDVTLKANIKSLSGAISKIKRLNPVSFTWREDGIRSQGFIAQEVEKVLPELVKTNPQTKLKSVQYGNITAILVAGMKEQQARIEQLEAELETLKIRLNKNSL